MNNIITFKSKLFLLAVILSGITKMHAATITVSSATEQTGVNYNTIQAAYNYIQNLSKTTDITQPYTIEVQSSYAATGETYPIRFEGVGGASTTNTITIQPATGAKITLSNPDAAGAESKTLIFDGAGYVIIDGISRNGETGFIIQNPNIISAHTILFTNGSIQNTVKNCTIKGISASKGSAAISNAVIAFDALSGNGNIIESNDICNIEGGYPVTMILVANEAASANEYQTIRNNKIYNYNYIEGVLDGIAAAVHVSGASSNVHILNNKIFWTGTIEATKSALYGILFAANSTGAGSRVEDNMIGGTDADNSGIATFDMTGEFRGISTNLNSTVKNNTVKNITFSTSSPNAYIISVFGNGVALDDIDSWSGNTVDGINMLYATGNTTSNLYCLYIYPTTATPARRINNNTVSNCVHKSTPMITTIIRGIYIAPIAYNNFGNIPSSEWTYSGNKIFNLTCDETDNGTVMHGIIALDTHKNTKTIEKTLIYNLKSSNTVNKETLLYGIRLNGSNPAGTIIKNNIVSIGNGVTGSSQIRAIIQNVATTNNDPISIVNNTVYIAGEQNLTAENANAHSNAIYRDGNTVAAITIKNNILMNVRTTNKMNDVHAAIWSQVGHTQITTSDNNILIAPVTVKGGSSNFITLADWHVANGEAKDMNSSNSDPLFNAPTDETPDFEISSLISPAYQKGVFLADVVDDFAGRTRIDNEGKMDIGAYSIGNFSATQNINSDILSVYSRNSTIIFNNLSGKTAQLYSTNGSLIASIFIPSNNFTTQSSKGLFLIRIDKKMIKVLVQ